MPLTLKMDELLVEGTADLVFKEGGTWVVVDFKTDQEIRGNLEHYRRQISLYSEAVSKTFGKDCSAFLMRI